MNHPMSLDQVLMVISLSTYVVGALLLILYFFSRDEWQRNLAIPIVVAMPMYKIVTIVDLRRVGHRTNGAAVMVVRMPWRTHQVHGQDEHQHPMQ